MKKYFTIVYTFNTGYNTIHTVWATDEESALNDFKRFIDGKDHTIKSVTERVMLKHTC